jgi:hypothetical protein
MTKKVTLSILAIVLAGCVLLSAALILVAVLIARGSTSPAAVAPTATESSIDLQMDEIQSQVQSYRGLTMTQPLSRALLTTDELKDHVINEFFADYTDEEAKDDAEELSAFGLLPKDFDLHDFYVKLYSEQIAGYYDNKTKDMYVVSDEGFGGTERMTYAHEFTHVLQDQTYDMENGLKMNDDYCKDHSEYCAAVTALIEGDATLSEQYWYYKYSTDQDKQQIDEFQQTYTSPVYDSAPAYMKEDFLFPYSQGLDFVSSLYKQGQWKAVDAAYKNPPVSTEQIIHPEKYPNDEPIDVTLPDLLKTLGKNWREVDRNTMGEWYTYLLLADGRDASFRLEDQTAKDASAGWGGDAYIYYTNDSNDEFAMVWKSVWDTSADKEEFWQASQTYGQDRWGDPQQQGQDSISWNTTDDGYVTMVDTGSAVLWVMAPSAEVNAQLTAALEAGN